MTAESIFFTVIIPVIRANYLAAALKSVLEQDFCNFEVIVINDASKEAIAETISKFLTDKRVQYFENSVNQGAESPARVWNQGLALAKGKFTLVLGDDDYYGLGLFKELYALSKQYPHAAVLRARLCCVDAQENVLYYGCRLPEWEPWWDILYSRTVYRRPLSICEHAFLTSKLRESGGFWELHKAWGSDEVAVLKLALDNGCASTNCGWAYWRNDQVNISAQSLSLEKSHAIKEICRWQEKLILEQGKSIDLSWQALLSAVKRRQREVHQSALLSMRKRTLKYKVVAQIKNVVRPLLGWSQY